MRLNNITTYWINFPIPLHLGKLFLNEIKISQNLLRNAQGLGEVMFEEDSGFSKNCCVQSRWEQVFSKVM